MSNAGRSACRSLNGTVVVAAALMMLGTSVSSAATAVETSVLTLELRGMATSTALLTCDPAGGTHIQAAAACEQLAEIDGNFAQLSDDHYVCTQEFAPVTARAVGRWQGQAVNFEHTYPNPCILRAETGQVFSF